MGVLLAAGRATAAIFSPARELFEASSHWAIVRWFWALDWTSTQVSLSPFAEQIRNHHRTAFSEALGLAAGLLIVEHIAGDALPPGIWRGGPMLVDVDSLGPSGKRPDLLILFGGPARETYALETKGNSSGRNYSVKQLRRGIDQVLAVSGPAQKLVVSAATSGDEVSTHAVSVAGPEASTPGAILDAAGEKAMAMERRRLASFAGVPGPDSEGSPHLIPELELEVIGRRLTLPGERLAAEVTMGVDREVFRRLGKVGSVAELAEMRSTVSRDGRRWPSRDQIAVPLTETGQAAAIALDGCALSISLR